MIEETNGERSVAPVLREVVVRVGRQRAFEVFTARMGTWWKPEHRLGEAPFADIVLEPRAGGRWYEVDAQGRTRDWGRVLTWAPPDRVVLAWQLDADWSYDAGFETEVEIRFVRVDDETTRVVLEHRHLERYGERVAQARAGLDSTGGWAGLLQGFATAC